MEIKQINQNRWPLQIFSNSSWALRLKLTCLQTASSDASCLFKLKLERGVHILFLVGVFWATLFLVSAASSFKIGVLKASLEWMSPMAARDLAFDSFRRTSLSMSWLKETTSLCLLSALEFRASSSYIPYESSHYQYLVAITLNLSIGESHAPPELLLTSFKWSCWPLQLFALQSFEGNLDDLAIPDHTNQR
jgi:hypothetical protein